jgi:chromosome segregation ATPase
VKSDDPTLNVLREIRDEIRSTNERLDQTREDLGNKIDQTREDLGRRIDQTNQLVGHTNQRVDHTNQRVDQLNRRVTEMDVRLSTELSELNGTTRDIVTLMQERRDDLRPRLERCERDIEELKKSRG